MPRSPEIAEFEHTPPTAGWGHAILWLTVLIVASGLFWAYHAELSEVTRSEGRIIPSGQVRVVQNLEGGIVAELPVKEGERVERHQVLLRIDDTRFAASFRENRLQALALRARIARLEAEAEARENWQPDPEQTEPPLEAFLEDEYALYQARRQARQAGLAILRQQQTQARHTLEELKARRAQAGRGHELVKRELKITRPLVKQGIMSEVELLRLERESNELTGELESLRAALPGAEAALAEVREKIRQADMQFRAEALAELNQARAELSRLGESGVALEDRVTRTAVRSPVRGTVKRILVNTIGGVVQPGMDLVEIVPAEDDLLVEARVRPADIAFLHPGQKAMLKFTAYDFAVYGGLEAHLEHISADAISGERGETFFLIRLRAERRHLGDAEAPLPIIPGMTVIVDIITGEKTVLDYLLKPLRRAQERALRER